MIKPITQTERTLLKRLPKRGHFDRETIYAILDAAFICHVGFVLDGQPFVMPTAFARIGDRLLIHGSAASRMLRALAGGIDVCVTVTHVDGLVLARSAFHHSINYRSVVILGKAEVVTDEAEKAAAMEAFTEHLIPGRWNDVRWPTANELKATFVLMLPIQEASAKIRTGNPIDDDEDYAMDVWAGVIPLAISPGRPIPDTMLNAAVNPPEYVQKYRLDGTHD